MVTLRIHHGVPDFDAWLRAFEADPVGRQRGGVRRYHVRRGVLDPHLATVDLELDDLPAAEAFLARLQRLWLGAGRSVMQRPEAWILAPVATAEVVGG